MAPAGRILLGRLRCSSCSCFAAGVSSKGGHVADPVGILANLAGLWGGAQAAALSPLSYVNSNQTFAAPQRTRSARNVVLG